MSRNSILANRLREVFLNGHWIANTNYKEQIQSVDWQQATCKVHQMNTIASLTYHINYYLKGLLDAFKTGRLEIHDKYSFLLDEITSASDWEKLVADFLNNASMFSNAIEDMDDHQFDLPFVDKKYGTLLRNIEGVIEHSYYHLGQISLIKKIITQTHPRQFT